MSLPKNNSVACLHGLQNFTAAVTVPASHRIPCYIDIQSLTRCKVTA